MPDIVIKGAAPVYDTEHLARVFFPQARWRQKASTKGDVIYVCLGPTHMAAALRLNGACVAAVRRRTSDDLDLEKSRLSRLLYDLLRQATGLRPPWGVLTGVRPVRLLQKKARALGEQGAKTYLLHQCDVAAKKYEIAYRIYRKQKPVLAASLPHSYSLYISIPFCPSRCAYCSFVSSTVASDTFLMDAYLQYLDRELAITAQLARECGLRLESIYIGGGTPTSLDAVQLGRLLASVATYFDIRAVAEYTVEAGRPDCTDWEKLVLLHRHGVSRISINPQSMSNAVLRQIGRDHTASDIVRCFHLAREAGHRTINMDMIAGLPGDSPESFSYSVQQVLSLKPENITLHTLTLKRGSGLAAAGFQADTPVSGLLDRAYADLARAGYDPYYLYRQKSTLDNLENTGWTKPGTEGLYNIYIMEEVHSILSVGAGAVTKLVHDKGEIIERIYNHKFPSDYIDNIETMMERKKGVKEFYARYLDT